MQQNSSHMVNYVKESRDRFISRRCPKLFGMLVVELYCLFFFSKQSLHNNTMSYTDAVCVTEQKLLWKAF